MRKIEIAADDGARAEAFTHGAHVTSWKTAGGDERLFLSERSAFAAGAPIRGGIPVIFPQFGSMGPLEKHGFVRLAEWEAMRVGRAANGRGEAQFRLTATPRTKALWNHTFQTSVVVTVQGMTLAVALSVANTDTAAFDFTAALHTYFRVDDARTVCVMGLQGIAYRDAAAGGIENVQQEEELRLNGEVDRIYLGVPGALEVRDEVRRTKVAQTGFSDVVVWNPGAELAAKLSDLEPGGWLRMLCVEAAIVSAPVRLEPGERWTGQQTLTAL